MKTLKGLETWHEFVKNKNHKNLSDFIDDDAILYSPVVFTPIEGSFMISRYLMAAREIIANNNFKYVREVCDDENAILEFVTKINEKIIVIKNPPRNHVLSAYRESEFLVLPSKWELSPLTPLEGFAFKKTVISTTSHGIPYTIKHEENGLLVEPKNSEKLAESIIYLLENKQKSEEFGLNGYNLVQEICNSKIMCEKTLDMYKKIINR